MADDFHPFPVDLGRAGDRHFLFSSGVGLDASVVQRVDAHPSRKTRFGAWYYAYAAVATFNRRYLLNPPRVRVKADGHQVGGVTVVFENFDPFTYFRRRPIRVAEGAGLDSGSLAMAVLKRASVLELPTLIPRLLSAHPRTVLRHRQVEGLQNVLEARVTSLDDRPFPVQVDGDYLGDFEKVEYGVAPGGLLAVA